MRSGRGVNLIVRVRGSAEVNVVGGGRERGGSIGLMVVYMGSSWIGGMVGRLGKRRVDSIDEYVGLFGIQGGDVAGLMW